MQEARVPVDSATCPGQLLLFRRAHLNGLAGEYEVGVPDEVPPCKIVVVERISREALGDVPERVTFFDDVKRAARCLRGGRRRRRLPGSCNGCRRRPLRHGRWGLRGGNRLLRSRLEQTPGPRPPAAQPRPRCHAPPWGSERAPTRTGRRQRRQSAARLRRRPQSFAGRGGQADPPRPASGRRVPSERALLLRPPARAWVRAPMQRRVRPAPGLPCRFALHHVMVARVGMVADQARGRLRLLVPQFSPLPE